jgi:DNA mismatch repair protein MutS2
VRNGRYVIPVRATARARVGGIVHDASATRSTVFIEPPEVIELGNDVRAREGEEQREVLRVLRALTDLARPHQGTIAGAVEMAVAFDDLCARARYAAATNGFAPAVGDGPLAIRQGRHPLLLADDAVVVPFDLVLAPDEWTVLVSGPNTGGKTVLMKAVGLLGLLAQSGVVPPVGPGTTLPLFTRVFADIGDASRSPPASPPSRPTRAPWPRCSSTPARAPSSCSTRSAAAPTRPRAARSPPRCCAR